MSFGLAHAAMLAGLAGLAIPLVIHLLTLRKAPTVDWGAMMFLDPGRRARRRIRLAEILLLLGRMALLGLIALAAARPFWKPPAAPAATTTAGGGSGARRDLVIVLDGSESMGRRGAGGATPRDRALAWARGLVGKLRPGDSAALLVAGDRVRPLLAPATFDPAAALAALAKVPEPRGGADLPAALAEALRLLEGATNPTREVVVLTDGRRSGWRPGERARWALLRDLAGAATVPARIWAVTFDPGPPGADSGADGSVGPIELARGLVAPGAPLAVSAVVANAGPGELVRSAELLIDGRPLPGAAQTIGPIPAGGRSPVSFRATIDEPGSHAVAIRLAPGAADPLAANDEAARPVEVAAALSVLLIDGDPRPEPLAGESDFLRAALAPAGDDAPAVVARAVAADAFAPADLDGTRVAVLADLERPTPALAATLAAFLNAGGGVLVAPGDRAVADAYNDVLANAGGWLPARLGPRRGEPGARKAAAHPAPRTFVGPSLAPLAAGESPPLAEASLFYYRELLTSPPAPGASVAARLDTGDPWLIERPVGRGRAALLAGPLDAAGGTLPVNPDFVPWAHELIFRLADSSAGGAPVKPGEPLVFPLPTPPPAGTNELSVHTPSGDLARATIERHGPTARARLTDAAEAGLYRLDLPDPPGGAVYAAVAADGREADPAPLDPAEAAALADGWPFQFATTPAAADRALVDLLSGGSNAGPRPLWRLLVFAGLGALGLEIAATRALARSRAMVPA